MPKTKELLTQWFSKNMSLTSRKYANYELDKAEFSLHFAGLSHLLTVLMGLLLPLRILS
jgi:hypothetical protein